MAQNTPELHPLSPTQFASLEPFASVLLDVILPEATAGEWLTRDHESKEDLKRITRAVEQSLNNLLGHPLAPAIYVHALKVCAHFYVKAQQRFAEPKRTFALDALDHAYVLIARLQGFHNLHDLYTLLG